MTGREKRRVGAALLGALVVIALVILAVTWLSDHCDGGGTSAARLPGQSGESDAAAGSQPPGDSATGSPASGTGSPLLAGSTPGSTLAETADDVPHRVVITVTSDESIPVMAYQFRGQPQSTTLSNVKSPVVIARNVTGTRPFAAVSLQQSPLARKASCTITIDGAVASARTVRKAYAVTACVA